MANKPNPGSEEAQKQGCKCAVIDNHYGEGLSYPGVKGPAFWITADCPIHGTKAESEAKP